jgi:hypothetical protein
MGLFHREVVEDEEARRGPTPLLADRKIFTKRAVTGNQHHVSNSDGDDDDRPVANYLPRGCKLVRSPSRHHLGIVRKSAMSPLNGCDDAPADQGRRTPAPFLIPTVFETQISIDEVASKYSHMYTLARGWY